MSTPQTTAPSTPKNNEAKSRREIITLWLSFVTALLSLVATIITLIGAMKSNPSSKGLVQNFHIGATYITTGHLPQDEPIVAPVPPTPIPASPTSTATPTPTPTPTPVPSPVPTALSQEAQDVRDGIGKDMLSGQSLLNDTIATLPPSPIARQVFIYVDVQAERTTPNKLALINATILCNKVQNGSVSQYIVSGMLGSVFQKSGKLPYILPADTALNISATVKATNSTPEQVTINHVETLRR